VDRRLTNISREEMGYDIVDWIEEAQDEYNNQDPANTTTRFQFSENTVSFL
jgi:hypothetical protein